MALALLKRLFGGKKPAAKPRALVVDDEKALQRLMLMRLEQLGYAVAVAGNSEEALAAVAGKKRFDLLVLDIRMPGMNGINLANKLRELPQTRAVPILFVTGAFGPSELEKLKARFHNCAALTKPFRAEQLDALLDELIAVAK